MERRRWMDGGGYITSSYCSPTTTIDDDDRKSERKKKVDLDIYFFCKRHLSRTRTDQEQHHACGRHGLSHSLHPARSCDYLLLLLPLLPSHPFRRLHRQMHQYALHTHLLQEVPEDHNYTGLWVLTLGRGSCINVFIYWIGAFGLGLNLHDWIGFFSHYLTAGEYRVLLIGRSV
ncbi:hypothetical protein FN846DRAFT_954608 [Sphaerosporella brunnea]|uniref:Uncharacterized protein n=1 Tax=Sphaerosporella brunnea TaxID=1250544 RepID=A0A5J5ET41_9PEZI|nr:hypothetical protein FN846DRAFT_954608 [Sphaerosporella brunnea]